MSRAYPVTLPPESALAPGYADADLADAYAIRLPASASADVDVLARAMLARPPGWVAPLMGARDAIMGLVGVKTARQIERGSRARARDTIGFFPVRERLGNEIILGEDDRHLDFRSAIILRDDDAGSRELVWSTVVHCRNRLGRIYLAAITPFHRVIVPAYLKRVG